MSVHSRLARRDRAWHGSAVQWFKLGMAAGAAWLAAAALACGQAAYVWESDQPDEPPAAPEGMVLDQADLLARHPAVFERISTRLLALRKDTGFRLYVVIQSGLTTREPGVLAERLHEAWVAGPEGLVAVYETDSRKAAFSRPFLTHPEAATRLGSLDYFAVIGRALDGWDRKQPEPAQVEQLAGLLVDGFRAILKTAELQHPPGRTLKLALLLVGGAALLALGVVVACKFRRRPHQPGDRFWFEDREQPERLGAPSGGGSVATVKF